MIYIPILFVILTNKLIDKVDTQQKEEVFVTSSTAFIHIATKKKLLERVILHDSKSVSSAIKLNHLNHLELGR